MPPDPTAAPVVAVVVAADPGPWLEECLTALGDQDHPNLSVLLIDAGEDDLAARAASVLPDCYVRRLGQRTPFGAAANELLGLVEGAAYLLICHDDVAPDPSAVSELVAEAARANAGVVSPKLVSWDDPSRLLAVGAVADRLGTVQALVEPGELDQEQHDSPRDVFVAPGAAVLVRADLFGELGGYDPDVPDLGEDLDLCWRAQLAGARVGVAPTARVRHLLATSTGQRAGPDRRRAAAVADRHRWHSLLSCTSAVSLLWLLPLALLYTLGEALTALLSGRPGWARDVLMAPAAVLGRPGRLRVARRRAQRCRHIPDRRVRRLQTPGNARLRSWLRHRAEGSSPALPGVAVVPAWGADPPAAAWAPGVDAGAGSASAWGAEPSAPAVALGEPVATYRAGRVRSAWPPATATAVAVLVVLAVGSRSLLTHPLPDVGSLPSAGGGVGAWWRAWWTTWQVAGLGSRGAGPPGAGMLALAASILGGSVGAARHLAVLAPLAVGPLGAWRMARPWGPPAARVVAAVAYAAVPLPYDAMAAGDWRGLVAVAALPWILAALARCSDALPYPSTTWTGVAHRLAAVGLLVGFSAAFCPALLLVVPVTAAGLAAGSVLAGQLPVAARTLAVGVAASAVGAVLLAPWSIGALGHPAALLGPAGVATPRTVGGLLRFAAGPIGTGPLGWGLLVAAALPLLIGRSWRLAWAARLWVLVLVAVAWEWLGGAGVVPAPPVSVGLAPAAAALAGAAALGAVAFVQDLPGYRFGWRQAATGAAAVALALACLPVLVGAGGGSWGQPSSGPDTALSSLAGAPGGGDYLVLWVGRPGALPLASTPFGGGIGWATTWDGLPGPSADWSAGSPGGTAAVASALHDAEAGLTSHLGRLLGPLGIRYLVVPAADGPSGSGASPAPVQPALLAALARQTDLAPELLDPAYTVYAVTDAVPVRAALTPAAAAAAAGVHSKRALDQLDLAGSAPVLPGPPSGAAGTLPAADEVYLAGAAGRGWRLEVAGRSVALRPVLAGSGLLSRGPAPAGPAVLRAPADLAVRVGDLAELVLWAGAVALAAAARSRRSERGATAEVVEAEWFRPLARTSRRRPDGDRRTPDEDAWVDA